MFRLKSVRVIDNPEMRLAFPVVEDGHIRELVRFKLDIVHVHTPFTVGLLGKYIATHQGIPIFYTHHTHYPEYAKAYLKERVVLPYLAQSLSAWFANSPMPSLRRPPRSRPFSGRTACARPSTSCPQGSGCGSSEGRRRPRETHVPCGATRDWTRRKGVALCGKLGTEKNIEFLVRAFEALRTIRRHVHFVLVGDGPIRNRLQSLVTRLALNDAVIFGGPVAHGKIAAYYQAADLFVFSSLTDTQASSCSKPSPAASRCRTQRQGVHVDGEEWPKRISGAADSLPHAVRQTNRRTTPG